MKTKLFILCLSAVLITNVSFAKVWRVNNNVGVSADFTTAQNAFFSSKVVNGDTIYFEGSNIAYGRDDTIRKSLTLIGPGYFLEPNFWPYPVQYNINTAKLGNLYVFYPNVTIIGLTLAEVHIYGPGYDPFGGNHPADNFSISRCYTHNILVSGIVFNTLISQNFMWGLIAFGPETPAVPKFQITNNIVAYGLLLQKTLIDVSGFISMVEYNDFNMGNDISNFEFSDGIFIFRNNILRAVTDTIIYDSLFIFLNNMAENSTFLPDGSGNQNHIPMGGISMFVDGTKKIPDDGDSFYQLSFASPANTASPSGTAIGAYAGATPYKRSGIPTIPTIYSLSMLGVATGNNTQVTFSSRSNADLLSVHLIKQAEWFLNDDPGMGKAKSVTINPAPDINAFAFPIDISSLPNGDHRLYIRTKDDNGSNGSWSLTNNIGFAVNNPGVNSLVIETDSVTQNITGNAANEVDDGIYKLVTLTPTGGAPNALNGDVKTKVTLNDTVPLFNNLPYVRRYYDIIPSVNPANAQADVKLYFTQPDFDNYNAYITRNNLTIPLLPTGGTDNGNLRITQFHGEYTGFSDPANYNGPGVVIIPTVAWDNSNRWWIVSFPVTGFSGFYLSTVNLTVLPLTLLEFKGRLQENTVNLQWSTTNEVNTKEFVIERSTQNTAYKAIGKVSAQSTSGTNQYNFIDANTGTGINFYRLKMIDKDGHFSYSKILPFEIKVANFILSVYPSPVKNVLHIKTSSAGNNIITMQVSDLSGKLLLKKVVIVGNGESITPLDVSKLSAGSYFLKVSSANSKGNYVKKFVKE